MTYLLWRLNFINMYQYFCYFCSKNTVHIVFDNRYEQAADQIDDVQTAVTTMTESQVSTRSIVNYSL